MSTNKGLIDCIEHRVMMGERWDTLAWHYYGNPFDFGRIISANPALNMDTVLTSGTLVLIPLIDEVSPVVAALDLPPWKR